MSPLGITPDLAAVSVNVDDYTVLERAVIMTAAITDNQPQSLEEPERTRYGRQSAAPKMPEHKNVFFCRTVMLSFSCHKKEDEQSDVAGGLCGFLVDTLKPFSSHA